MDDYFISSRAYLARAQGQLGAGTQASLFYAAFELRCGIEARLQEYLEPHEHIPEGRRTDWRVGNLHRTTEQAFSLGDQVARLQISCRGSRTPVATLFYTPVSARLKALAEKFGNYLHVAKSYRSADDPSWKDLRTQLDEAARLLSDATTGTLLGPMLLESGTQNATMPVEILPDDPQGATILKELKGVDLIVDVRYFPDLQTAQTVQANKR